MEKQGELFIYFYLLPFSLCSLLSHHFSLTSRRLMNDLHSTRLVVYRRRRRRARDSPSRRPRNFLLGDSIPPEPRGEGEKHQTIRFISPWCRIGGAMLLFIITSLIYCNLSKRLNLNPQSILFKY